MESVFNHLFHCIIITIVLYFFMILLLKQSSSKALKNSVLIGAFALIYMILFGHNLPKL